MNYSIRWDSKAHKNLGKIEQELQQIIVEKLEDAAQDPFCFLEHFEGRNLYKLRLGEYRALIEIDFIQKILIIRFLDH